MKKIEQLSDKQISFSLLFFAILFRGFYAIYYFVFQSPSKTNIYYDVALEIIEQGRFFYDTSNSYFDVVAPVIPWMNALTMIIFGKSYLGLYLVTVVGSALITYYTYKTARLFLNKSTSLFAGIWSLFYLFYYYYTPNPGKDIWMAFFMIFLIYMLLKLFAKNEFTYKAYLFFIFMYVVSFHIDERYIIFSPFIFLYILYHETLSFNKFRIKKTFLYVIVVVLLMVPWTIRNYNKFDKIVILSTRTERYTDRLFGYESNSNILDKAYELEEEYYIFDNQIDSVLAGTKTVTDFGYEIGEAQIRAMKNGELPKPLTGMKAFQSRITSMFEPFQIKGRFERSGYFYYKKSFRHNIATFLFYGLLLLFSIPGFYYLYKINKTAFYLFISTIIIYALLHALTIPYTNWRYRLPLDSIFIIVGCLGITQTFRKIVSGFWSS